MRAREIGSVKGEEERKKRLGLGAVLGNFWISGFSRSMDLECRIQVSLRGCSAILEPLEGVYQRVYPLSVDGVLLRKRLGFCLCFRGSYS
jgi:hypothetical protein